MNNNKLVTRIRSALRISLLPVMFSLLVGCSSGGDSTPPPPSINITNTSVLEGDGGTSSLVFTVTANAAVGSNASVHYATSNGTATTADLDYTAQSGTLGFTQGSTSATITILVTGDTLLEADETLTLTLSSPSNLTLGATTVATGTITNDDAATFNGYFSGSATVNISVNITDLVGLAYDNRLMLFSRSGASNVLYDITAITNTTDNNYTGTATVYINGSSAQTDVAVTATINGSQITGTLAGTGLGLGSFDIAFDTANNAGATLARVEGTGSAGWNGNLFGYDVDTVTFGSVSGGYASIDGTNERCHYAANFVLPDMQFNIYQMAHNITNPGVGTCTAPYLSTGHTGLASVITTTTTDDTLVYAFSNGTIALFAVVSH